MFESLISEVLALAFVENVLRFSKYGSFNPDWFMKISVKFLLTRERDSVNILFDLANCSDFPLR